MDLTVFIGPIVCTFFSLLQRISPNIKQLQTNMAEMVSDKYTLLIFCWSNCDFEFFEFF